MAASFVDGVRETVRNAYCTFADQGENLAAFLNAAVNNPLPNIRTPISPDEYVGLTAWICNRPPAPIDPNPFDPPLPIGQCSTSYVVGVDYQPGGISGSEPADSTAPGTFQGPFNNFRRETSSNGQQWEWKVDGVNASDIFLGAVFKSGFPDPTGEFYARRVDGLPDDCSDGTPNIPPPVPVPDIPGDIVIDDPAGPITIPVGVGFLIPVITVSGELNVGFDLRGSEFELSGTLNVSTGDINLNFGGNKPDNKLCCLPEFPDFDPPPTDDDPDEEEDDRIIDGVVVTTTMVQEGIKPSTIGQQLGPDFYHPRLGNVHFKIKIGSAFVWTEDIPVRNRQQYVPCPISFGAAGVVGDPIQGVQWTLTPVYRTIPRSEAPT